MWMQGLMGCVDAGVDGLQGAGDDAGEGASTEEGQHAQVQRQVGVSSLPLVCYFVKMTPFCFYCKFG